MFPMRRELKATTSRRVLKAACEAEMFPMRRELKAGSVAWATKSSVMKQRCSR